MTIHYSPKLERQILSGIVKHPEMFGDIDLMISEYDFAVTQHQTIYCVIKQALINREPLDKILLSQKLKVLNLKFEDQINIEDYIENVLLVPVTKEVLKGGIKELKLLKAKREIIEASKKVIDNINKSQSPSIDAIVSESMALFNDTVDSYEPDEKPADLFATLEATIHDRAKNPVTETGLITPFKLFNEYYGGIRAGNGVYAVVSRPKQGKSTWLFQMAESIPILNPGCKVLILDTEMTTEVSQYRAASSYTQIPMWYLESGQWKSIKKYAEKMKNGIQVGNLKGHVFHQKVANRPIEQIESIIRRWYYNVVGMGNPAMVVYDYIKLTGEKIGQNWAEYQAIGDKINRLNDVGSKLNIQIFTACQQNRSGEREGADDSASIAQSDRLQWFAAWVGIFRRKRPEEIDQYGGPQWGSHILIPTATRFQGKNAPGHMDLVRVPVREGKKTTFRSERNFINYNVENFRVTEHGDYQDIIDSNNEIYGEDDGHDVSDTNL